jgi:hypothetical protein
MPDGGPIGVVGVGVGVGLGVGVGVGVGAGVEGESGALTVDETGVTD